MHTDLSRPKTHLKPTPAHGGLVLKHGRGVVCVFLGLVLLGLATSPPSSGPGRWLASFRWEPFGKVTAPASPFLAT